MIKKIVCIFVALFMFVSLFVGCGTGKGNVANTTSTETKTTDTAAQTTAVQKDVTLKYVDWLGTSLNDLIQSEFVKANPNIKVDAQTFDGAQYDKLLMTKILSGDAPDVFLIQWPQYAKMVKQGYLADVTNEPGMEMMKTTASASQSFTVDGKMYGFMAENQGGPLPIFYNKKYFDKNGYTIPKTQDELLQLCEKIKTAGVTPLVFGEKDKWPLEYFFRARMFTGTLPTDPEWALSLYNGKVKPSEMHKKEFEMADMLFKKGYIGKQDLTMDYNQAIQYFIDGKAAMIPTGVWLPAMKPITDADKSKFELGAFITPVDPVNGKVYCTGEVAAALVVSANSKNPAEAKKFYDSFISPTFMAKFLDLQGALNYLPIQHKIDPIIQPIADALGSSSYEMYLSQKASLPASFVNDAIGNGLQNTIAGSPVDTELKKLDGEFEKIKSQIEVAN